MKTFKLKGNLGGGAWCVTSLCRILVLKMKKLWLISECDYFFFCDYVFICKRCHFIIQIFFTFSYHSISDFYICVHKYRKIIWKLQRSWAVAQSLKNKQTLSYRDVYSTGTHHTGSSVYNYIASDDALGEALSYICSTLIPRNCNYIQQNQRIFLCSRRSGVWNVSGAIQSLLPLGF